MKPFPSLLLIIFITSIFTMGAGAASQPNLLFIFADDQCFDTIRSLGNEEIETPNLDRLVKRSTNFTHAYNMGSWSGAVCVASRHMLNTGAFLWHAEEASKNLKAAYEEKNLLWSQQLAGAGYDTYFTGKWHVKANPEDIFTVTNNIRGGMPKQTDTGYNRPLADGSDPWDPTDPKFGGFWEGGTHWSEVVGNDAIDFLGMSKKSENPFFMYIAFNAPHDPRQSPKEYVQKYPLENIGIPASYLPEYPYNEPMKSGRKLRDEKLGPFPRTEHSIKVHRQEYYAIITHMDAQIGRILDALEAKGLEDSTYIFFSADHGLAVGHHGLMGKQNMFDHSVRVPLLVAGPDIPAGETNRARVYLQDIMPTTLELAGAEKPEDVQFKSLLPLVHGDARKSYDAIYGAYLDGQRAVTKGKHKLILYPQVPVALLFDLKNDPGEMKDLLGDQSNLPTAKKLFQALLGLQKETGDTMDLVSIYPELL